MIFSRIKNLWEVGKLEWIAPELKHIVHHIKACSTNNWQDHQNKNLMRTLSRSWKKWGNSQRKSRLNLPLILIKRKEGRSKIDCNGKVKAELLERKNKNSCLKNLNLRDFNILNSSRKCPRESKTLGWKVLKQTE